MTCWTVSANCLSCAWVRRDSTTWMWTSGMILPADDVGAVVSEDGVGLADGLDDVPSSCPPRRKGDVVARANVDDASGFFVSQSSVARDDVTRLGIGPVHDRPAAGLAFPDTDLSVGTRRHRQRLELRITGVSSRTSACWIEVTLNDVAGQVNEFSHVHLLAELVCTGEVFEYS